MPSFTLTQIATEAVQELSGSLDSGESLSTQQLADALAVANDLLYSWYQEQAQALNQLVSRQNKLIQVLIDQLASEGAPLAIAYTLVNAGYIAASVNGPSISGIGTPPQFPDTVTATFLPNAYGRALKFGMAIELAGEYGVEVPASVLVAYREARAAANPMPGKIPIPGLSVQSETGGQ